MIFISTIINSIPPGTRDLVEFGFLHGSRYDRRSSRLDMNLLHIVPMFFAILSGTVMITTLFVVMIDSMEA